MKNKEILILPRIPYFSEIVKGIDLPLNITKGRYLQLEIIIKKQKVTMLLNGKDLKEFSYVWLSSLWDRRDLAYAVDIYLNHHNVPHNQVDKTTSKLTDQLILCLNNIPCADTYFIEEPDLVKNIQKIERICGYPVIVKNVYGSKGKFSAHGVDQKHLLENYAGLPKNHRYIFQRYIPNDYDWGVLVANGKVVSAEQSYHKNGEFRNHAYHGSTEVFVDAAKMPEEIKNIAVKASRLLGLSWSRSDIIVNKHTQKPYLLEVNRFPGMTSGSSEIAAAQEYIKSIYEKTKD